MENRPDESTDKSWRAAHAALFLALMGLTYLNPGFRAWPWFWLVPLGSYFALAAIVPPLRRTLAGLRTGRVTTRTGIATAAIVVVSSTVLLTYQAIIQPDVSELGASLPVQALCGVLLAGVIFALVNATLEELVFRGVLFDAIECEWGRRAAIGATAILFGMGHLHGYPPGGFGACLAGVYGLMLGVLRVQTGGLLLPIVAHVAADATIYAILTKHSA